MQAEDHEDAGDREPRPVAGSSIGDDDAAWFSGVRHVTVDLTILTARPLKDQDYFADR